MFAVAQSNGIVTVQPSTLRVSRGGAAAGTATIEGSVTPATGNGSVQLKLADFNERLLNAALGPALAPRGWERDC